MTEAPSLTRTKDHWLGRFQAMASPCEILMDVDDRRLARRLLAIAQAEASRIEHKFSRYRKDSVIQRINHSDGQPVVVDEETAALLDYANQCYELSESRFDITSGVLRRVWRFDGSDRIPSADEVANILPLIGWHKITWRRPEITVPPGMEIDLGGIGKEYAVDRTARLIADQSDASILVNYGGDLYVNTPRRNGCGWFVGVENPASSPQLAEGSKSIHRFELRHGGLATSGDSRRYLLANGIRYSHILNPATGWPIEDAPHSVTVAAATCTEAGLLATFAMLQGAQAESFLRTEGVQYWCVC
ncbi:FAD:protein FMN transferase [Thiohalomonas denitrificans]|uniref:FAD:protein FMN transferase n=1 Tax=Thiohalomonas denitrificans TaxID=415747 RepID=A0A1G5PWK6_9GAMM|nr:FAD:protein FMN transferase [Thiohalomonas denitrificans]SCZ53606.1 thiamine biosynthesis lipoprotein [Thiohalomonas denitrificans]